jgi:hypothetical protein
LGRGSSIGAAVASHFQLHRVNGNVEGDFSEPASLRTYIRADDYVMVGNIKGVSGASDDEGAANLAGWRFIKESDFAAGAR